jgi:hypothetical protein
VRLSDSVPGALLDEEGHIDCDLITEIVPYDAVTQFVGERLPVAVTFPDCVVDNVARDDEVAESDFCAVRDWRAEIDMVLLMLTQVLAVLVADSDRVAFPVADAM